MITLKTSLLSENLGFNGEDIQVKSISAAWNKIREIRDTTEPQVLEGTVLTVELPEGETSDRIPGKILFKLNAKGKMEFKDFAKVESREAKEAEKEVKSEKAAASRSGKKKFETKAGKIEIDKIFNPAY